MIYIISWKHGINLGSKISLTHHKRLFRAIRAQSQSADLVLSICAGGHLHLCNRVHKARMDEDSTLVWFGSSSVLSTDVEPENGA